MDRIHAVERQAMRLDGHVVADGPAWSGIVRGLERPLTRRERAAVVRERIQPGLVAADGTAAWVYDGLAPGVRVRVAARAGRKPMRDRPDLDLSYPRLTAADVVDVAGLAITSPGRTIADLAIDPAVSIARIVALIDDLRRDRVGALGALDDLAGAAHAALAGRWGARDARRRLAEAGLDVDAGRVNP